MTRRGSGAVPRPDAVVLTAVAALLGLAVTLAARGWPAVHHARPSLSTHAALETAATLIAGVVAFLAYGRARRGGGGRDALLATSFVLLGAADFGFGLLPTLVNDGVPAPFPSWSALVVRLVGAAMLVAAAMLPARRASAALLGGIGVVLALLAVGVVVLWFVRSGLPAAVSIRPGRLLSGHPVAQVIQLGQLVLYAVASVCFTARARVTGDRLDAWIGAGTALGAFSRLNYVVYPSMYSQWVYAGDVLRIGFYLLLLAGAAFEVRGYWAAQAEAAVFAERRRMARDLHDGAVQEIGYIRAIASRSGGRLDPERIVAAAERALDEMRSALTALSAPIDEPLAETVRRAACEVADRYDVPVDFVADASVQATHTEREALVRIVREAVANAARHGGAHKVVVELDGAGPRRIVVRDDGHGFEPQQERNGGFGLTSMRDRAAALGGSLTVASEPGRGTVVAVTW